jgi:hypothetical protein
MSTGAAERDVQPAVALVSADARETLGEQPHTA